MINYRVRNLDRLLERLTSAGVRQVDTLEEYVYGRFAWVLDVEGNRVELWEPPAGTP
jgi:predicted enzyme related to lactoylglutathione lyase